jgi:hypothetical protein
VLQGTPQLRKHPVLSNKTLADNIKSLAYKFGLKNSTLEGFLDLYSILVESGKYEFFRVCKKC